MQTAIIAAIAAGTFFIWAYRRAMTELMEFTIQIDGCPKKER